jgi:hypothetical protein
MRHIRFSIASLITAILLVGFGFAALREANDTWDSSTFSIALEESVVWTGSTSSDCSGSQVDVCSK